MKNNETSLGKNIILITEEDTNLSNEMLQKGEY